ncbi:CASEINE KINASE 1 [Encephalitozoon cuniculi GB-M1]|uniref:Probable casein kinase I homolog ECU11_1980 n=1 Tax=Encephalitozoon cuniculi (strain GB-M1) TaxID=284813 RepID=KC12_ENCCU|nr:protein kinase [Encephalitozoon cuniculi GB-M1]Q8SQR2.1 RecName: Full=Probable casein kinase I homolog ECU11_1980 [Encephalitozoon cuniculi GB-M1]KMV65156.1 protein kinase [Encephalitozoon cuniculi EcunIII-L]UYI26408.1 casein kinase [Encephalitozoon cuniculi]CAD26108.1 CASEINE KINASE 1 [Encephalitozoon cuniculi GB-M1]
MRGEIMDYTICREIGKGGFGKVYEVKKKADQKSYALKIETNAPKAGRNSIINEIQAYSELQGCEKIPRLVDHGSYEGLTFLVLPLLKYSLKDLLERHPRFFTKKSATIVGKKLLNAIEFIHGKGRLHRDIKPENVMFGHNNRIYLVDFGMSAPYLRGDGSHIPEVGGKSVSGTLWYMSINTHRGIEQSRRDDLESLFYLLILLYKSRLPWMEPGASVSKKQEARTKEIKENLSVYDLCDGIHGKEHLIKFFQHISSLEFAEKPNYRYLNSLLDKIFHSNKELQGYKRAPKKEDTGLIRTSLWHKFISILSPFEVKYDG